MPSRSRFSALSLFLMVIAISVVAAVVVRVRSYSGSQEAGTSSGAHRVSGNQATEPIPVSGSAGSSTVTESSASSTVSTGTVVEAAPAPAVTRAQRFRELLAMGMAKLPGVSGEALPPAARPTPPAPAPVHPQPAKAVQPAYVPNSARPAGGAPVATQPSGTGSTGGKGTTPATTTSDPNSDTIAPQLVSLEFNPPKINDGGETMLTIVATDDLSGIRAISGTLSSPTGKAIQSFSQQRDGETNRYLSRITMPKDAEEGVWKVTFLTLTDNATNMATLNYAQGTIPPTAVLQVTSSRSDSSPPTLRNVWLAKRAMHTGESNTLFVDADDDKSGVRLVAAVFVSPSKIARIGVGCKKGDGDVWECPVAPPECLDCGDWSLEQLQLQDNANNYATVRQDNPLVREIKVNIAGDSCDHTPPVLQSVSLDKQAITIGQGEPLVAITLMVTDDGCGIGGVSGHAVGPGTNAGTTFAFSPQGDSGAWVGYVRLSANVPRGMWRLQSVTVNDKGQNVRIYYENDPLLQRATFLVR